LARRVITLKRICAEEPLAGLQFEFDFLDDDLDGLMVGVFIGHILLLSRNLGRL
jgi:hypothetical protein